MLKQKNRVWNNVWQTENKMFSETRPAFAFSKINLHYYFEKYQSLTKKKKKKRINETHKSC